MSERERQLDETTGTGFDLDTEIDADTDLDFDFDSDSEKGPMVRETTARESTAEKSDSERSGRLRRRLGSLFSVRAFGLSLVFAVGGAVLASSVVPLGPGWILGVVVAAFLYGLGADARRYPELVLAGALAGGGWALLGNAALAVFGLGFPIVALGALVGGVAGAIGHYFGHDLRDGLTRDL